MKRFKLSRCLAACAALWLFTPFADAAPGPVTFVTVYNQGIGLVRQVRLLELGEGLQEYSYQGVAAKIDPTSVHLRAPGVTVLEQNYEYDLVGREALMNRYLGEAVEVETEGGVVQGDLLSSSPEAVILREGGGTVRMIRPDAIRAVTFPRLPEGLTLRPTLRWQLLAEKKGKTEAELSYITRGITWEASYVAVLAAGEKALDLSGWVQIDNRSGATYEDAGLKLMAGDVRLIQPARGRGAGAERYLATDGMKKAGFEEKTFFEYHLYTLPRPVTVKDRQTKQISLFEPARAATRKIFTYDWREDEKKVEVTLEFVNDEENGLDIPLPKGKVRLYKRDTDGSLEFIGEDRIDHTPRKEKLRLHTGKAFDLTVERNRTDYQRRGTVVETAYRVEFRNAKREPVEIVVVEHLPYSNWQVAEESLQGEKTGAFRYEWTLPVPAEGKATLTYRIKGW